MPSLPVMPQVNRDYARLLLVMRKLIRAEFDVTISLEQAEAPTLLIHYARRSDDTLLHEMANELEEWLTPPPADAMPAVPAPEPLCYRGVPLARAAAPAAEEEHKVKRVYRGRVIEG